MDATFPQLPGQDRDADIEIDSIDESPVLFLGDEAGDGVFAAVALQGAHVLSWCPPGRDEVLFVSDQARFEPGVAVRGGIPVCFPWFGPGRTGSMTPAHGPARVSPWELVAARRDGEGFVAQLRLPSSDDAPELRLTATFSQTLVLEAELSGRPGQTCELALHTYFGVGDVAEVSVAGLDGCAYWDQLTDTRETQAGEVRFAGETDRVYDVDGPLTLTDPTLGRAIRIEQEGLGSAIVWNPWADKAARTADLGDEEWRGFVCVESGAVRERALVLDGEGRARARVTLTVETLPAGEGA